MKFALAVLVSLFAVSASAEISKATLQEIVDSFELMPDEEGEAYYLYQSTSEYIDKKLTRNELERIIGRRISRDEKNWIGDVYAVGSRNEYLINVQYYDTCVESEIVVHAMDQKLKPVEGVNQKYQIIDNDTCPD